MIARPRVALTLLAALFLLALPAVASAAVYEVNSTADEEDAAPGVGGCLTAGLKCTLRAAIEESNASTSVNDEIVFSSAFDGKKADSTIAIVFSLPTIEDEVKIDGGRCETDAGVEGPCVEVSGESRLAVRAANSQVEGLAISGSQIAIAVEAEEFQARGDWIGFHLDGTSGAGEQPYGIFVAPHADNAVIGGTTAADRNVIGNTNSGVVLRGASSGTVLGNYFGVEPDGTTPASNGRDLVVADKEELLASVPATDDQIGVNVGEVGAETPECDLGCNVFASEAINAVAAIDLQGSEFEEELPATGPTEIEGNYIGLDANGEAFTEAATSGVRVGSADGVTIGGPEPGQANQIHGGTNGVFAGSGGEPALDLTVEGNRIGRSLDGSASLDPPSKGISASSEGITEVADTAQFVNNSIAAGQVGIESHSTGAEIAGNSITGAEVGVHIWGDTEASGIGNLIEGNEIVDPVEEGILIENDFNEIFGNKISGAGASGILIQPFLSLGADENLVGGDVPGTENRIFGSGDDAIEIRDFEGTFTEVARNLGAENGGRFIRLEAINPGTEPVGPNGGIEPPSVTAAGKTEASGSAEPFALVRVFRKASAEKGELGAFLEEATADAGGNWSVPYPALPGKTLVTATQTKEGGTSELADPQATPADPSPPTPGGGGNGGGGGSTPDTTAPTVKITKGPKAKSTSTTAKFKFKANEAGSTFQCKLDKGKFKNCRSPKTYKKLKPGKHLFKVRATDKAGNVGKPAKRTFTVLP
ncbi:MAG TPA: NosD domain-containing protein [Solirubrobacterales bacterium]|nr:NosD domain-containing protein [Solirubrobacterales bacterium]